MPLPNFIIVGAAKSGTTSLYYYIRQHPDIFMPDEKEPRFFLDWKGGVSDPAAYEKLFDGAGKKKAVGEATTSYLYAPEAPGKIKAKLGLIKIIIILRNPADMAFSLWRFMCRIGKRGESLSFEQALACEAERMRDPGFQSQTDVWHGQFYYFSRGLYHDQVKRYIDHFGAENVSVHLFEDFKRDPLKTCREIFKFLGVDQNFVPILRKQNIGNVRHRGLQKLLTHPTASQARLAAVLPAGLKFWLRNILLGFNSKPAPPMGRQLRKDLLQKYAPDIEKLEKLIKRDLSIWLGEKERSGTKKGNQPADLTR